MDDEQVKLAAYKEGVLDQRLAGVDAHLAVVNGSIERTANELNRLFTLVEGRLETKAERSRVHELAAELAATSLRLAALDQVAVKKEGPIMERIDANSRRLDVLEAGMPVDLLKLKESLLETIREGQTGGALRLWASAGTAFGAAFGIVLAAAKAAGWL